MKAYLFSHALALATVVAWLVMLTRLSRARRTPQSTLAWLLAFALVPLLAIPLYLALGQRKFPRRAKGGQLLVPPIRSGNRLELLSTGESAFARLVELIRGARRSVDVTMFILGNDETGRAVVSALGDCAHRGIEVRVILDAVGSFTTARKARRALTARGARVKVFMPLRHSPVRGRTNLRSHRKIVIVDNEIVFAGGMNLASEYMGPPLSEDATPRWRDVVAVVRGPVAVDATDLFESDWAFCGGSVRPRSDLPVDAKEKPGEERVQFVPSGPDMITDTMYDLLLTGIFTARRRIVIVTPYFVPDDALQHALSLAAQRGVSTEILVPAWSNHRIADIARREFLRELKESGALVHYYEKGMVHAKAMVIDDAFAYVGSPNFDMRSLFLNYENALCFYSPPSVRTVSDFADRLIAECGEAPFFKERPVLEKLALLVSPEL